MQAGGVDDRHRPKVAEKVEMVVHLDYMFVTGGKEDLEQKKLEQKEWHALTVLVGVDKVTGAISSTPCPKKGAVPYVVKASSDYLRRLRTENITIQTDNEDAILNLIAAVVESTPELRMPVGQ